MKKVFWVVLLLPLGISLLAQDGDPSYAVSERGPHQAVWQRVTWTTNQIGRAVARTNSFVELATGLNFFDQATQQWQPSREEWQAYPDAIVAQAGRHKVILATNLNLGGSVDVLLPSVDGLSPVRLISNPVGLGFYDPVDGKQVLIAEIKDCAPQWGAATNGIVFRDCFDGIRGSIRYLYTRAGIHQHVVLEQRLQLPEGFSDKTRLECYTEFAPNTPQPQITTRVLRREKDPILRAQMVEPDFTDAEPNFGDMAMRGGTAFTLGDTSETQSIRVGKRFDVIAGRPVLTEAVEWTQLEPLLAGLATVQRSKTGSFALNSSRELPRAKRHAGLPRERLCTPGNEKEIQLAASPFSEPAVVIDYELLSSAGNTTLQGDTTYYVSGLVTLSGTTRIEGGTVVKLTNSSAAKINITGTIDCQTAAYRPAIFTSKNEDSVGETISGSTGNASNYPSALVISASGSVLHDLRFAYATNGVTLDFAVGQISLTNVQFVKCKYPIDSSANDENTIIVDNGLFHLAKYGIKGGHDLIVRGQHLTAHNCEQFAYSQSGGDSYAYLTNCLFVGVTNWGSDFTFTTNSTVYYSTDLGGIFQTVGAGAHYLANGSTNRDAGTTNISTNLLAALRKKTTYPPIILATNSFSTDTNLVPQATRDTNGLADLGFHYDPIDYLTYWCKVTNATLTLSEGVVLACYNDTGVWLVDRSSIVSVGTPLIPNWFTRYSCVQEQPLTLGSDVGFDVNSFHYGTNAPSGTFRFTKFTGPAGDAYHLYHATDWAFTNLTVRDCEFWNGRCLLGGSSSSAGAATVNNNLFYRSRPWALNTSSQQSLGFSNNLVLGAFAAFYGPGSDLWKVYDNAFDTCTFYISAHLVTNGYNAYINCPYRLSPNSANDVVLTNFSYATGPLGDFYQVSTNLFNTGSLTSAALAGMYHYTTQTNQVKETNSPVDIGFHYVATVYGIPIDTDGDGVADYFEDTTGNGTFDTGDFGDWTNFLYSTMSFSGLASNQITSVISRPDTMGAIGPSHYMEVINGAVAIYAKSNGMQLVKTNLEDFLRVTVPTDPDFAGTYPNPDTGDYAGDPRVLYDPLSQRWFACALNAFNRHTLLAISKTSDPVGSGGVTWVSNQWDHYLVPTGGRPPLTNLMDQPRLAVDSNGVYIANYALARDVHDTDKLRVAAMPKVSILDSTNTVQTNFIFDCSSNYRAQPALNFDPVATNDPVWFISVNGTNLYYNQLLWTNGFTDPPGFQMTNWGQLAITNSFLTNTLLGGNAPLLDADGFIFDQLMSTMVRKINGTQYLWTCHHIGVNRYGTNATPSDADRDAIEWFKTQITPTVGITETGRIFDDATTNPKFYYYPSLAVNTRGEVGIGFSGSSVTSLVGAYYWGKLGNGASLSMNAPVCYFPGRVSTNALATIKGGDYSSTTLDPVDGLTFWTIQVYAETNSPAPGYTWGTAVGRISPY